MSALFYHACPSKANVSSLFGVSRHMGFTHVRIYIDK